MKKELVKLHAQISKCKKCKLWKNANKAVPEEGPENTKIMLVGQNHGEKEDETGKPFLGKAGIYLDKVLKKNKKCRKKQFITSIVKHKTP